MKEIKSVIDFLSIIQSHTKKYQSENEKHFSVNGSIAQGPSWYKYKPNFWFRGHADFNWKLQPKVERHDFINSASSAISTKTGYEHTIFRQFLVRAPHLLPVNLDLSGKYFLAQHHGLPTRLLDWSTNPLVALFFACSAHKETDGSIYILYARGDYDHDEHEDFIYQSDEKVSQSIEAICNNSSSTPKQSLYPLRITPNTQHGRISSQGARFTFHPENSHPLEKQLNRNVYRFKIFSPCKTDIMEELSILNTNWSTLFPDLDHLVKEIKWQTNTL